MVHPYRDKRSETQAYGNRDLILSLVAKRNEMGYKKGWVFYRLSDLMDLARMSERDWEFLAHQLGYSADWAKIKYAEHSDDDEEYIDVNLEY